MQLVAHTELQRHALDRPGTVVAQHRALVDVQAAVGAAHWVVDGDAVGGTRARRRDALAHLHLAHLATTVLLAQVAVVQVDLPVRATHRTIELKTAVRTLALGARLCSGRWREIDRLRHGKNVTMTRTYFDDCPHKR